MEEAAEHLSASPDGLEACHSQMEEAMASRGSSWGSCGLRGSVLWNHYFLLTQEALRLVLTKSRSPLELLDESSLGFSEENLASRWPLAPTLGEGEEPATAN